MARVTVEDCIDKVPNRFDLVLLASQRARQVAAGAPITIERGRDKNPVLALREIAAETVSPEELEEAVIKELQKYLPGDEPEDELMELLAEEQEIAGQEQVEKEVSEMAVEGDEVLEEAEAPGPVEEPSEKELAAEFEAEMANLGEADDSLDDIAEEASEE